MGRNRDKIKQLWKENWILSRIKKFLPKDQTGRMKGEFSMGGDLMDTIFSKNGKVGITHLKKRRELKD